MGVLALGIFERLTKLSWSVRAFVAYYYGDTIETLGAVGKVRVVVKVLRGQMPGSNDTVTMLYVGRLLNYSHFVKKYFAQTEVLFSKTATLLTYRKAMKDAENDVDVVFVDIGWPYNNRINANGTYLELPDWICMTVPLQDTWDDTVQNFRKTMRKNIGRLIRKNNYRCSRTNDLATVKSFYKTFYVPFITSRHADETHLTSRSLIEDRALAGTILQVEGDDGVVAAGVYFPVGDTLRLLVTGMPEDYLDNPPVAAMQALYYFSLKYAHEEGLKAVNFMGTRAFPTNGLFQFKRKWGAHAEDSFSIDSILFRPNNTQAAAKFCERFPMISRKGEALQLVLSTTAKTFDEAECAKLLSDHHCGGIDHVKVVQITDEPTEDVAFTLADQVLVHVKKSKTGSFAESYVQDSPNAKSAPPEQLKDDTGQTTS